MKQSGEKPTGHDINQSEGGMSKVLNRLQHVAGNLKKRRQQSATLGPLGAEVPRAQVRDISAKELLQLRRHLELSQQQLAQWLNVSLVSVSRWERGHGHPSAREARTLARLAELVAAVGDRLTPKEMTRFFGDPHEDLYNDRPVDVLASEIGYRAVRHLLEHVLNAEYA